MTPIFVTFTRPDLLREQWLDVAPEHEPDLKRLLREIDREPDPSRRSPAVRVDVTWPNGHRGPLLASAVRSISPAPRRQAG